MRAVPMRVLVRLRAVVMLALVIIVVVVVFASRLAVIELGRPQTLPSRQVFTRKRRIFFDGPGDERGRSLSRFGRCGRMRAVGWSHRTSAGDPEQ